MKFIYQARTVKGEIKSGIIEASSKDSALELLQKSGLFVTYLEEEKLPIFSKELKIFRKISLRDLVLFSRQFAVLFSSGVPIVESLSTLAGQTKNLELREIVSDLSKEVESGTSLSNSLLKYRKIFSPFFIAMIKAGEASGKLSECLNYLAEHLEREYNLKSKITGALIYPAIILILFLVILTLMVFLILPSFEEILLESGVDVPLITKMVLFFSRFLRNNFLILFLLIFFPILILIRYFKTEDGKKKFDRLVLKIPFLGQIISQSLLSRLSVNLSTLISSGLMITESLEILENIVGNEIYRKAISEIRESVKKGISISSISSLYPEIFPPLFNQMVLVGEKTGKLSTCLIQVGEFYQKESERSIENFIRILEPLLIVSLGILVGGLMATVLLPLYRIVGAY